METNGYFASVNHVKSTYKLARALPEKAYSTIKLNNHYTMTWCVNQQE